MLAAVLSSLFSRTKSALWQIYPDLAPLRTAVNARDWTAVSGFFGGYPTGFDASTAVTTVGQLDGAEVFLQRMVDEVTSISRAPRAVVPATWRFRLPERECPM